MFHTKVWNTYPEFRRLCFHPNNEGQKNPVQASQDRAKGVVAGVSDYIILIPRGKYHYCCLEFKLPNQKQRPEQIQFEDKVREAGGFYRVVFSHEEAWDLFENYLRLSNASGL